MGQGSARLRSFAAAYAALRWGRTGVKRAKKGQPGAEWADSGPVEAQIDSRPSQSPVSCIPSSFRFISPLATQVRVRVGFNTRSFLSLSAVCCLLCGALI